MQLIVINVMIMMMVAIWRLTWRRRYHSWSRWRHLPSPPRSQPSAVPDQEKHVVSTQLKMRNLCHISSHEVPHNRLVTLVPFLFLTHFSLKKYFYNPPTKRVIKESMERFVWIWLVHRFHMFLLPQGRVATHPKEGPPGTNNLKPIKSSVISTDLRL